MHHGQNYPGSENLQIPNAHPPILTIEKRYQQFRVDQAALIRVCLNYPFTQATFGFSINKIVCSTLPFSLLLGRLEKGANPHNRKFVLTREANYHPDGGQVFFPVTKEPFVLLLALPGDDIKLEDFVAFYCDGSCGVQIKVQD